MLHVDLHNQVVLVTGAASGIGEALGRALAGCGARLALLDREREGVEAIAATLGSPGAQALPLAADVRDTAAIERAVEQAWEHFGQVDALVNNAGVYPVTPLLALSAAEWDAVLDTNLRAPLFTTQALARRLIAAGRGGRVVNVSSTAGTLARPGIAHYGASKAGLNQLTRILAIELAPHGILVNAVCPGVIETPRVKAHNASPEGREEAAAKRDKVPLQRFGQPDDIVNMILYLLSPEAGYCCGGLFTVDGGFTLGIPAYGPAGPGTG